MTVFFECSRPASGPFWYRSRTMYRLGFAWFAIGILRVSFHEFATTAFDWRMSGWGNQ